MSGFWYTAAIATTFSALLSTVIGLNQVSFRPQDAASSPKKAAADARLANFFSARSKGSGSLQGSDEIALENALEIYDQALELANQAVKAHQAAVTASEAGETARSLSFARREYSLWQHSLKLLGNIPAQSDRHQQATEKKILYRKLLANAEAEVADGDSDVLAEIVRTAGIDPSLVHITLCQIEPPQIEASRRAAKQGKTVKNNPAFSNLLSAQGDVARDHCREHQGNQRMASPASLIKLPVAVVLMHKVITEEIDLNQKIFIDPGNFTENAAGAQIEVGQSYPLREVMARMINESNNIATNQLIDYLGRDYLAKTLNQLGYRQTLVDHKLVGDRAMPENAGTLANEITSNEVTTMMAKIYSLTAPGDKELLHALLNQRDLELGYTGLKDLGPNVTWIGEKTGQNNQLIGSTLAVKIGLNRYALTVAIDGGGDPYAIQQIVRGVATYILETGPLVSNLTI